MSAELKTQEQAGGVLHGRALALAGDWAAGRAVLEACLDDPATCRQARHLLWEICQAMGEPAAGIAHLRAMLSECPLTMRPAAAPRRRILALARLGDFQTNLPLDPLLDDQDCELATLWYDQEQPHPACLDPALVHEMLPGLDLVWIVIAQDERSAPALAWADALAGRLGLPVINTGQAIAAMNRAGVSALLAPIADAVVPPVALLPRAGLEAGGMPCPYPAILRPLHSHAGLGLHRLAGPQDLPAALAESPRAQAFHVSPFVDFRGADGLYGKSRIVFVEGRPYPFHHALHDDWRVWYYNAGMASSADKRAVEARFLADLPGFYGPRAMAALEAIGRAVPLDYFGLDCAVLPDGRLLVFEVETGMIVHDRDDPILYPAKAAWVPRIFRAVEAMLDRRIRNPRGPHP